MNTREEDQDHLQIVRRAWLHIRVAITITTFGFLGLVGVLVPGERHEVLWNWLLAGDQFFLIGGAIYFWFARGHCRDAQNGCTNQHLELYKRRFPWD